MRWVGLATVGLCVAALSATAQDDKPRSPSPPGDAPGAVHKQMAKRVGEYDTVSKFFLKPGSSAQESTGTAKITSILGGRFLSEEGSGKQFGMPAASLK